jgi:hypothetical protein
MIQSESKDFGETAGFSRNRMIQLEPKIQPQPQDSFGTKDLAGTERL